MSKPRINAGVKFFFSSHLLMIPSIAYSIATSSCKLLVKKSMGLGQGRKGFYRCTLAVLLFCVPDTENHHCGND